MLALDKALAVKDSIVTFQTSVGNELRASLLRLDRFEVAFEIYGPPTVLRASEVLSDFRIIVNDRLIYAGRAVVSNLVDAGVALVCQASLDEASWVDVEVVSAASAPAELARGFTTFIEEWQKLYRVRAEYKLIVADMQSFFIQLRLWLDQVELGIRATPSGDRLKLEQALTEELSGPVIAAMNVLFEKFEAVAKGLDEELEPVHRSYMRQQLHPWVMSAPFPHRTFNKPLGYAGDYEMVNMMLRTVHEGGSLFAKLVNAWFLHQAPAQAHRNRVRYLADKLTAEALRAKSAGREARIFNVACGPAHEVQKFLAEQTLSSNSSFTLLDFNEETLQYARTQLTEISTRNGRGAKLNFVKRSVQAVLKEGGRTVARPAQEQYDVVYCAGLFDYLSDPICQRLLNIMYEWLAPGGVLITTNVDPGNPMRKGMEHLLDWHLIYRTGPRMLAMKPRQAGEDATSVHSDETGVNVFLEVRKPNG